MQASDTTSQRIVVPLTVPDADTAVLADLLAQTPALTPALVAQAAAYRDETAELYEQTQAMLEQGLR